MESLSSDELNKLNTIKAELVKEKILFDDEWLIGVLRSLRAFQASSNVNSKHVLRKWMNTDLAAMGISKSTIPDEAYSSRGYTIDDDLTLQVNSIRDISKPSFEDDCDFLQIDEEETEGFNEQPNKALNAQNNPGRSNQKTKAPRTLELILSDGVRAIKAIEYKPLPGFCVDALQPGTKIILRSPAEVSVHVVLLKPCNIDVIGGQVEALKVKRRKSDEAYLGNHNQVQDSQLLQTGRQATEHNAAAANLFPIFVQREGEREEASTAASDTCQDEFFDDEFDDSFDGVIAALPESALLSGTSSHSQSTPGSADSGVSEIPVRNGRFATIEDDDDEVISID